MTFYTISVLCIFPCNVKKFFQKVDQLFDRTKSLLVTRAYQRVDKNLLWQFWHRCAVDLFSSISWILECRCCLLVDWILALKKWNLRYFLANAITFNLTVSHFAIIRSFSKRANSRRSWIVVRSFQSRSMAKPIKTMAAMTPRTIPRRKTFGGHSGCCWARTCSVTVPFFSTVSLYTNWYRQSSSS